MKVSKELNIKVTGRNLIDVLCARIDDTNRRCYDSEIIKFLKTVSAEQLWQIVS